MTLIERSVFATNISNDNEDLTSSSHNNSTLVISNNIDISDCDNNILSDSNRHNNSDVNDERDMDTVDESLIISESTKFSLTLSVLVVFSSMFIDCLLLTLPFSFLSDCLSSTGADPFEIGLLFGSKAAVQVIFNPLIGYLVNVIGPVIPLFAGSIVVIMSTAIFAIVPLKFEFYWWLIAARSIQGIGSSAAFVAGASYLSLVYKNDKDRGAALGSAMAGYGLAAIVGPVLGGVLYWSGGQLLPFLLVSGLAAIQLTVFIILFFIRSPPLIQFVNEARGSNQKFPSFSSQLSVMVDPYVLILCIALALVNAALSMQEFLYPIYLTNKYDNPSSLIVGLLFFPLTVGYCITTPFVGRFGLLLGRYTFICIGLLLTGVTLFCFPLPNNLFLQILLMIGMGLGLGCIDGSTPPLLARLLDVRHSNKYYDNRYNGKERNNNNNGLPDENNDVSVGGGLYGIVFAAADLSFSLGYVVGASLGSWLDKSFGYETLCRMFGISVIIIIIPLFASRGVIAKADKDGIGLKENLIQTNHIQDRQNREDKYEHHDDNEEDEDNEEEEDDDESYDDEDVDEGSKSTNYQPPSYLSDGSK